MRIPETPDGVPSRDDASARRALTVWIRIRFVHVALQIALVWPALRYGWTLEADLPWILAAILFLLAFNLVTLGWLRAELRIPPPLPWLQAAGDLGALTLLYSLSGGLTNPMHTLVHFHIGLAGLLLPTRAAVAALGVGLGGLTLLALSTQRLTDPYVWVGPLGPNLATEWLLALSVAGLSIFAARQRDGVDARLRAARERMRMQDRLRAAGAVAAGFCHELASPLNAAGLLAGRLRRKLGDGAYREDWNDLQESLEQCDRMVRAMAGAALDPDALRLQRTDAAAVARAVARGWNGSAPLRFTEAAPESAPFPLFVNAPPLGLAQSLDTLLRNADEAMSGGRSDGDAMPLELSVTADADAVRFTVSDRGTGIDAETLRRLGNPFNSRKGAGRGLGLFSTLHLAEALGGTLELHPRPGGGTLATLTLPRIAGTTPVMQESPA